MDENLYIHVPFDLLLEKFDLIEQAKVNVEILFTGDVLDTLDDSGLGRVKDWLRKNGLVCTFHAPFRDMSPGGADARVRQVTLERYLRVIEIAHQLQPRCIVFHPGFDDIHDDENQRERWLKNSVQTWEAILKASGELTMCVENVFQASPSNLLALIQAIDSPRVGHCFDTGHFNLFADCTQDEWFDKLGPYIKEVHLHDNHGEKDDHLAIGDGEIDFDNIFAHIAKLPIQPELVLEAHSEEQAVLSISRMKHRLASQPAHALAY